MNSSSNKVPFDSESFFMALSSTNSSLKKNPEMDNRVFVVPVIQQQQNDELAEADDFTELMDMENITFSQADNGEAHNNPLNHAAIASSEMDCGVWDSLQPIHHANLQRFAEN